MEARLPGGQGGREDGGPPHDVREPLQEKVSELRRHESFLLAVGGPKVPGEVYKLADYNIAVTSQPHSEMAALAITLHDLQEGEELKKVFGDYKLKIIPSTSGKQVEQKP